jgi:hypothetical protein
MTKDRRCIACAESGEPDTFQPLHDAGANVIAWVHKARLEEYTSPTADEAEAKQFEGAENNNLADVLRELKEQRQ